MVKKIEYETDAQRVNRQHAMAQPRTKNKFRPRLRSEMPEEPTPVPMMADYARDELVILQTLQRAITNAIQHHRLARRVASGKASELEELAP